MGGEGVVVKDESVQDADGSVYALQGRRQDGEDEGNQDSMTSFGQVGPRISSISPPSSPPYLTVALTLTPVKWYAPHLQSNYLSGHFTLFLLNQ